MITGRERLLNAINHKESERIPRDLGSTRPTGIVRPAYRNLLDYMGKMDFPITQNDYGQDIVANTVSVDPFVLDHLGVDVKGLYMGRPDNSLDADVSVDTHIDELGVEWKSTGGLWSPDSSPLKDEFSLSSIRALSLPDPSDPGYIRGLRNQAVKIREENKFGLVMHLQDIIVHPSQNLLGMEDWFVNLMISKKEMKYLVEKVAELRIEQAISILKEVGDLVDVVGQADDLGTQQGPIISPELYEEMLLPCHKKYFREIRKHTSAKIFLHSCGSIRKFIPHFIDMGVDCLNPVQVSAAEMDPKSLKKEFGKDIVFWGGIDTQVLKTFSDVNRIKDEVKKTAEILGNGGGYVLAPIHNIQADIPPEVIEAIYSSC